MDSFIKLSNFGKIAPYAQLFRQGLLVTVLLSLFTVVIGFVLALILALMRWAPCMAFQIQSAFIYCDSLCRDPSFHTCSCTDLYHLLRCVRNDRPAVLPDVRIY